MDDWAWEQLEPWLQARVKLPVGPLFCIVTGPTRGRPWTADAARSELRRVAREAGVRRRFAPHQLRHAHAVEMAREGVPLIVIQRQLGHTNLGITSIYLQGIDNTEIIDTVHARRAPMVPVARGRRPRTEWRATPRMLRSSRSTDARGVSGRPDRAKEHSRCELRGYSRQAKGAASRSRRPRGTADSRRWQRKQRRSNMMNSHAGDEYGRASDACSRGSG
jgi:integrase-like protein